MRFGLIHRVMTEALAVLGLLALLTSGELDRALTIALSAALVGALLVPERWQQRPSFRYVGTLAPLLILALQLVRLALHGNALTIAVEFAAALQILRLMTRRGAAHDQQIILLALVHLIAGTVLGGGIAYGLCFLGFLIVAPGALALSHLRREVEGNYQQGARDRTGLPVDVPRILRSRRVIGKRFLLATSLLALPIFLFTALLFLAFPRVSLSLLLLNRDRSERMTGFSDKIDLGGVGLLRENPALVLRVELPNLPASPQERIALYLRGTAFDHYDGRSWSRTDPHALPAERLGNQIRVRRFYRPGDVRRMLIDLEPIEPPVVFTTDDTVSLTLLPRSNPLSPFPSLTRAPEGELRYVAAEDRGLRYELFTSPPGQEPPAPLAHPSRYLQLPAELSPRVAELARRWVGDARDRHQAARRIEQELQRGYQYSLDSPSGSAPQPLEHFLFESKQGHCEYYSTAMAVLLRTMGVPTRNVTGFVGGTYNRFGRYYTVRQGDAHSWVEVYLPDTGWTRFDPTPTAESAPQRATSLTTSLRDIVEAISQRWDRNVVGYDLKQQLSLVQHLEKNYGELSSGEGWLGRALRQPRRLLLTALGLALAAYGGHWLWKRRGRRATSSEQTEARAREQASRDARALYRQLEAILQAQGLPRPPGVPPLTHARHLLALGHPLAPEVLDLTARYTAARFGAATLTPEERARFQQRLKQLTAARRAPRAAPPPAPTARSSP